MSQIDAAPPLDPDLGRHTQAGFVTIGVLAAMVFGWGGLSQISGAVVAPGRIAVESSVKRVQHREGGIVSALLVREGDQVKAGQVLAKLDSTVSGANAAVIENQLLQYTARRARLEAERDGEPVVWPGGPAPAEAAPMLAAERRLAEARLAMAQQRKAQLREQIVQTEQEIDGAKAQVASHISQARLIEEEAVGMRKLYAQGYAPLAKVNQLEREAERLRGMEGELTAGVARSRTRIAEIRMQILQVDSERLSEVMADLKDTEVKLAQLSEQKVAADDEVRRVEVRSPAAGFVQQLQVHAKGAVVAPGETMMLVVPKDDALIVEARIDPQHVDQAAVGRKAHVRFTSFASQTTPELMGKVDRISADATTDEKTGVSYYSARLSLDAKDIPKALRGKLVPGMPAEVQIETTRRNALSYFFKPLSDQMARAFREE